MRLRLDLAYDGTDFSGWARQPGLRTVQGAVEDALARALRLPEPPQVTCAGRTDAGVHARGQVAHVDIDPSDDLSLALLARSLRGLLPDDAWLLDLSVAPEGFDARFSALSRSYRYAVCDDPQTWDPLRRREVLLHPRPLDLAAMNESAGSLLGERDFAAVCRPREGGTTIRRLLSLEWLRGDTGLAEMHVIADAFCHSMVRSLVGLLVPVGEGRRPVTWPGDVVERGVRDSGVHVMPAHGLVLEGVRYPEDADLAARQTVTRSVRGS
ncbi:MAG: tRNA pseudouridine(38-40) synthase TruA [Actinomycetota bacterium]